MSNQDYLQVKSPQESLELRGRTPGKKTGMTPIRPEKAGGNIKRRTGLLPIRPNKSPSGSKSPFSQGNKFKSGLLPIRYDSTDGAKYSTGKSPHGRQKFKTGLTPIRPNKSPGQQTTNKTPFGGNSSRPKSGLLPIRPGNIQNLNPLDTSNASFAARRRSGLLPIRPVRKNDACDGNESVISFLKPPAPSTGPFSISTFVSANTSDLKPAASQFTRRTSGILPVRQSLGSFGGLTNSKLPNPTKQPTRMSFEPKKPTVSTSKSASKKTVDPKSLNTISEELESPGDPKGHNLSGIQPLDETADTSFSLRSQSKRKSSLALRSWQNNSQKRNSRIPVSLPTVRALNFEVDEEAPIHRSVLKDTTSKLNSLSLTSDEAKPADAVEGNFLEKKDFEIAQTCPSLEELRNRRDKLKAELTELEELIREREAEEDVTKPRLSIESDFSDVDSPFGNIDSPVVVEPVELLNPQNVHKPEDLYKIARKSCSFLKTPKPSAFRKENFPSICGADDTPNIGSRLAQQLASLYDS